mmetsp:Transcript_94/g.131  ORF Transcript_94/g.131 Transcript_94/m.131 type:complete len:355 (+) Transcript_94:102-1166(+)|eukprot:CAMPEP_0194244932 /NCGR_PEP_ID=MMETSP0158-20130606/12276_1 /TAXON_ID=33649 /ORGANISM="Thalassionema nitzschioides, Strain L26-B" /LENGTH=354 /DNA_ID=CAMNT_0038980535 /DNA_START=34 /DNA_END=1098 /DNA_ORIENTATION=+
MIADVALSSVMSKARSEDQWIPACFGNCGNAEDGDKDYSKTTTAPILALKGIGTITLGRIGEESNILRDDIATWKKRTKDSIYIGSITYATYPELPEDYDDVEAVVYITNAEENSCVIIENVEEIPLYKVKKDLMKHGEKKDLLKLLLALEAHDFSGALKLVNDFLEVIQSRMEAENYTPQVEDTIATAFALHSKGVLEMINGVFKYAVYYFKEATDIKESLFGPKHNSTLESMEQLAIALYGFGYYAESHSTLRTIHSRSRSPVLAARIWNSLACLHFQKGDSPFALKCSERGSQLEASELMTTIAIANYGFILLTQGDSDGLRHLISAEKKLKHWLGPDNDIVQSIRYNINK